MNHESHIKIGEFVESVLKYSVFEEFEITKSEICLRQKLGPTWPPSDSASRKPRIKKTVGFELSSRLSEISNINHQRFCIVTRVGTLAERLLRLLL